MSNVVSEFPNWFGKGCEHFIGQWEDDEVTSGPNYMEYEPVLVHCNHPRNPSEFEGNCNARQCPLTKSIYNNINNNNTTN